MAPVAPVAPVVMLSLLVAFPLLGLVLCLVYRAPTRRGLVGLSLGPLLMVAELWHRGLDAELLEVRAWIPSLGASYSLALDGLGLISISLVAVIVPLALWSGSPKSLSSAMAGGVFVLETSLFGLLLARDLLWLMSCWSLAAVSMGLILTGCGARASAVRRFALTQLIGASVMIAVMVESYHRVVVQTGFASMDLGRWFGLVLFPDEQRWLFCLSLASLAIMFPGFTLGALGNRSGDDDETLTATSRILLSSGFGLVSPYLLVRFVLPSFPLGARESAELVMVLALAAILYAAISFGVSRGRHVTGLYLGYQGLFLLGLFSFHREGVLGSQLELAHFSLGLAALSIWEASRGKGVVQDVLLIGLVLGPPGLVGFPALSGILLGLWQRSPSVALVAITCWLGIGFGIVFRVLRRRRRREGNVQTASWRLVPILAVALALGLAPSFFKTRLDVTTELVLADSETRLRRE